MSKEFADMLGELLSAVRPGTIPMSTDPKQPESRYALPAIFVGVTPRQLRLPGTGTCNLSEFSFQCTWETIPNKYSVAVVQGELSAAVAAVVPKSWTRESWQEPLVRRTRFTDPQGVVAIVVQCPISDRDLVPRSYTVSLHIEAADQSPVLRDSAAK
jgi:hypothetical protein